MQRLEGQAEIDYSANNIKGKELNKQTGVVMNIIFRLGLIASFLLVAGCADMLGAIIPKSELPKTPGEFKTAAAGHPEYFAKYSYEVTGRTLNQIRSDWTTNGNKCLARKIKFEHFSSTPGMGTHKTGETNITYTPSLNAGNNELEFAVQELRDTPTNAVMPENGMYFTVINARSVGNNKIELTTYHMTRPLDYERVTRAVRLWAEGKSNGCPNLQAMVKGENYNW
ncbi:MAG: hypothetical protein SV201_00565 [Pseudomonadota bacterium]|nr:hypothetical protein [Pseudomonadota bacterium]